MNAPDVSVIIAVKNGGATLRACLESIAAQKACQVEVIVVDALSTDETQAVIEDFRSIVLRHIREADAGIYDAWNKGVARATGRWCAFLGADDRFADPDAARSLVAIGETDADLVLVYGDVRISGPPYEYVHSVDPTTIERRLARGAMIPHPGAVHRTSAIRAAGGFDPRYRIAGDLDLVRRLARRGRLARLPRVVVEMRRGGISSRAAMQVLRHCERLRIVRADGASTLDQFRVVAGGSAQFAGQVVEAALVRTLGVARGRRTSNRVRGFLGVRPR